MSLPVFSFTLLPDSNIETERLERQRNLFTPGVDFALDENGDLEWPLRFTTGLEAVAQGIRVRLLIIKGELEYNREYGIPWIANDFVSEEEAILGSKYDEVRYREIFRPMIMSTPGALELISMTFDHDREERSFAMDFEVRGEEGLIIGSLEV